MGQFDIVKLGVASRSETNLPKVQAVKPLGFADPDFVESFGELDMFGALGVTALPANASSNGDAADAVVVRDAGNANGIILAARDERTADITAELKPGETCVHSTGAGFDSRLFFKDRTASLIVGDGAVLTLTTDMLKVAAGGATLALGDDGGFSIVAKGGKAFITVTEDTIWLCAPKIMFGAAPTVPMIVGPVAPGAPSQSMLGSL